jgi:putative heme iron utilization protein
MTDKSSVLRETDDEALKTARLLLRESRSAALAAQEPDDTGFPFISRVLVGIDIDGTPVLLASRLATHTSALLFDPRCSLLVGRTGKGDPLTHPRMTIQCRAEAATTQEEIYARLRTRFLRRHPKAKLYIDFADFLFFRLNPERASLNKGFGLAYAITGDDLLIKSQATQDILLRESEVLDALNSNSAAIARLVADHPSGKAHGWRAIGIDAAGVNLARGEEIYRSDCPQPVQDMTEFGSLCVKLYR